MQFRPHFPNSFLIPYLVAFRHVGYLATGVGMMIEGDAILFTAAFLTSQGVFPLWKIATVVFAGVMIGDFLWYRLGILVHAAFPRIDRWVERLTSRFDAHLIGRTGRTIFASKFAYGLHHILLMRVGILGIPPKEFMKKDALASLVWIFIVGGLGYFSGESVALVRHYLRFTEVALLTGLLAFLLLEFLISRLSEFL